MQKIKTVFLIFLMITFLSGIYVYLSMSDRMDDKLKEDKSKKDKSKEDKSKEDKEPDDTMNEYTIKEDKVTDDNDDKNDIINENMDNMDTSNKPKTDTNCPNLLIQKGNVLALYNTNQSIVNGINPILFSNLDEYINYLEIQNNKGFSCPLLFLQQECNTQGQDVYRIRPSPFDLQGGLPTMSTIY